MGEPGRIGEGERGLNFEQEASCVGEREGEGDCICRDGRLGERPDI